MIYHEGKYISHGLHATNGVIKPIIKVYHEDKAFTTIGLTEKVLNRIKIVFPDTWENIVEQTILYLNNIAANNPMQAVTIIKFIDEDPMLICSLVDTGVYRIIYGAINPLPTDIPVSVNNRVQVKYMQELVSQDTPIFRTFPFKQSDNQFLRVFTHDNSWYYDITNGNGGYTRNIGGSATTDIWYEHEFGNKYIKEIATGTIIMSATSSQVDVQPCFYAIEHYRTWQDVNYYSKKQFFRVYNSDEELIGNCLPFERVIDGVVVAGYINLASGNFFYDKFGKLTIEYALPNGTPWEPPV